ncbi:hypothetical protein AB7W86_07550 [Providencia rettgeri]
MSSAAPNNQKYQITYKGKVYHTQDFADACLNCEGLKEYADAFKAFWLTGYHPSIGKDIETRKPREMLIDKHVRHAHVDTGNYAPEENKKHPNATKSSWLIWRTQIELAKVEPTSDAYLIYAVNDKRDAILISFIEDGAHKKSEEAQYLEYIMEKADFFYEKTSKRMPLGENMFSDKWLLTNQDTTD